MKKFYFDVLTTGLIYLKKNLNQDQVDLRKMDKYVDTVHEVLKKDNKKLNDLYEKTTYKQESFWESYKNDDTLVVSLKKDKDIDKISNLTLGTMPWSVLEASLSDEALNIIGLKKQTDEKGNVKLVAYSEEQINQEDVVNAGILLVKKMKREG